MVTEGGVSAQDGARRHQLLDVALEVFLKFGFRKTSMDEVARAANVSRQGLYLHFSRKEVLFRAVVEHALASALQAAGAQLENPTSTTLERLVGALDEWVGRYVGALGAGVSDLGEATNALVHALVHDENERFLALLTKFIRSSGLLAAYKPAGLTARQLAQTLNATARGLKYECRTRQQFVDAVSQAVRALCLPLGARA